MKHDINEYLSSRTKELWTTIEKACPKEVAQLKELDNIKKLAIKETIQEKSIIFTCASKSKGAEARGMETKNGFMVLRKSTASKTVKASMASWNVKFRDKLIGAKKLVDRGEYMEFVEDTLFNSASAAASIITGGSESGNERWKTDNGRTKLLDIRMITKRK